MIGGREGCLAYLINPDDKYCNASSGGGGVFAKLRRLMITEGGGLFGLFSEP